MRPRRHRRGEALLLIALLLVPLFLLALPAPPARGQLELEVQLGDLFFNPNEIQVDPGDEVRIHLVNIGTTHTFTIFAEPDTEQPRTTPALRDFYERTPKLVDVFVEAGQTAWANFTAPEEEGIYYLVCMVPGHIEGNMFGFFIVGNPPRDSVLGVGIVQLLILMAIVGTVIFSIVYHIRTTRSS